MMATKILLVEDDRFLADLYLTNLRLLGYKVVHSRDGADALKKLRKNDFNLVLLDLLLPKMSGFKVLETIKEKPKKSQDCKIFILTNLSQPEEVAKGKKFGADEYLIKANFTPKEIIDKIKAKFPNL